MPTKLLDKLSAAQQARFAEFRDKWLAAGLSTAPADREAAWKGVLAAYKIAGLQPPSLRIWLRSPLEGAVGTIFLGQMESTRKMVGDQVRAQVGDQVWDQVGAQVRAQVWDQVGAQVRDQVNWYAVYGQHEASWLAFFDFFARACGLEVARRVDGIGEVGRSAGWWWPYSGAVILTERPNRLERDDRNRLHSSTGAAIQYPDGWGIWAWHGVRVPQGVIEQPEALEPKAILAEANAEIRRVMIERLGVDRFLSGVKAKVIDRDTDKLGHQRRLLSVPQSGDETLVAVEVTNSTKEPDGTWKSYVLRVPPAMRDCASAVAWTFAMSKEEYQPAMES